MVARRALVALNWAAKREVKPFVCGRDSIFARSARICSSKLSDRTLRELCARRALARLFVHFKPIDGEAMQLLRGRGLDDRIDFLEKLSDKLAELFRVTL